MFSFKVAVIICVFLRNRASSLIKLRSSSALEWLSSTTIIHPDPGVASMHLVASSRCIFYSPLRSKLKLLRRCSTRVSVQL